MVTERSVSGACLIIRGNTEVEVTQIEDIWRVHGGKGCAVMLL